MLGSRLPMPVGAAMWTYQPQVLQPITPTTQVPLHRPKLDRALHLLSPSALVDFQKPLQWELECLLVILWVLAKVRFLTFAKSLLLWYSILYKHGIALATCCTVCHSFYKKKLFLLSPSSSERYLFFSVDNRQEGKR